MDAKFKYNRKDIERIQKVFRKKKNVDLRFEEAGHLWENTSSDYGGVDWLMLPKEDDEIINYIEEAPNYKSLEETIKR